MGVRVRAEDIRIVPSALEDARDAADAAFERLGRRLIDADVPTTAEGGDFLAWAATAHRIAPAEMKAFLEACKVVKRLAEAS